MLREDFGESTVRELNLTQKRQTSFSSPHYSSEVNKIKIKINSPTKRKKKITQVV